MWHAMHTCAMHTYACTLKTTQGVLTTLRLPFNLHSGAVSIPPCQQAANITRTDSFSRPSKRSALGSAVQRRGLLEALSLQVLEDAGRGEERLRFGLVLDLAGVARDRLRGRELPEEVGRDVVPARTGAAVRFVSGCTSVSIAVTKTAVYVTGDRLRALIKEVADAVRHGVVMVHVSVPATNKACKKEGFVT